MRIRMWIDDLLKDLRHTRRMLARNPLFFAVAIAMLALGIGANTAVFSLANAVLYRSLAVRNPAEVYYVRVEPGQPSGAHNTGNSSSSFSEPVFEQLRTRREAFANVLAYVAVGFNKVAVRTGATPEEAAVMMVSGDFFSGLGITPVCGRTFSLEDERDHAGVAVLGYAFWLRRYSQTCSVLGRTLYVKGVPFTIVGIAPKEFAGVEGPPTDVWIPLQRRRELNAWGMEGPSYYDDPKWWCLKLLARLAPGVKKEQALAIVEAAFQRAAYEPLGGKPRPGETPAKLVLAPARGIGETGEGLAKPLQILFAMVVLILAIACGNVAILLTARNAARQREFGIRVAIGVGRARLFRQLLAESLTLAASGGALGWLLAIAGARTLAAWAGLDINIAPDARVLLFTLALSAAAALVFGLAPLFTITRSPAGAALRETRATAFQSRSKSRAGRGVLVMQIAFCLALAVAAGLFVRTLRNLENQNLGLRADGLLVFGLDARSRAHSDEEAIRFYNGLLEKPRELPGVASATVMGNRLGSGWSNNTSAFVDGDDARVETSGGSNIMRWNNVGADYFTTMGIPILYGRDVNAADSFSAPKVAIVNETFARQFFPGRNPLGRQISYIPKVAYTIVGVAANSKYTGVRERDMPMAYFPFTQIPNVDEMHVAIRSLGAPATLWPAVRRAVGDFAPGLALLQPMTQRAQFDESIAQERLAARLSIAFGVLAALLVATGLYGSLAYNISRRTSELGVRMAVGATSGVLLRLILKEGLAISLLGIVVGIPLAFMTTRAIASLLYGISASDPLVLVSAALGVVLVGLVSSFIPAMRAASTDPLSALRNE